MSNIITVDLKSLENTKKLGHLLAAAMLANGVRLLLLYGGLGAGKTTLSRELVFSLKNGGEAEVCSPSFTLCNEYPTDPPVLHFDLYRTNEGQLDESFLEALDRLQEDDAPLVIVEWAERIQPYDQHFFPTRYIACHLTERENKRTAKLALQGDNALEIADSLRNVIE